MQNVNEMDFSQDDVSGFLFQYPDTEGSIDTIHQVIQKAKDHNVIYRSFQLMSNLINYFLVIDSSCMRNRSFVFVFA